MVMVIDDDPSVCATIARHLERKGYRTTCFSDGREAVASLAVLRPSAVVCDIQLPRMDGLQILSRAHHYDPDLVVILVTGLPDLQQTIEALRSGATDFLAKPIDFPQLHQSLRNGLNRRLARLESRRYQDRLEAEVHSRTKELMDVLGRLQEANSELKTSYHECLEMLRCASAFRDDETGRHIDRIRRFSRTLGRDYGLSGADLDTLEAASAMHDIGKIGISDEILLKPGPLTADEFETMKSHTTIGAGILGGRQTPLFIASAQIALTHHERWDGTGYPRGLAGEKIPIMGRIVAVVDVWDALTHERVYKPAMAVEEAIEVMRGLRGTHFDPDVLDAFFRVLPRLLEIDRQIESDPVLRPCVDAS